MYWDIGPRPSMHTFLNPYRPCIAISTRARSIPSLPEPFVPRLYKPKNCRCPDIPAGFQMAAGAGPMCEEPMWGVVLELEVRLGLANNTAGAAASADGDGWAVASSSGEAQVELQEDVYGPFSGQVSALRGGFCIQGGGGADAGFCVSLDYSFSRSSNRLRRPTRAGHDCGCHGLPEGDVGGGAAAGRGHVPRPGECVNKCGCVMTGHAHRPGGSVECVGRIVITGSGLGHFSCVTQMRHCSSSPQPLTHPMIPATLPPPLLLLPSLPLQHLPPPCPPLQVQAGAEALSGVYAVLGRRRSRILSEEVGQ